MYLSKLSNKYVPSKAAILPADGLFRWFAKAPSTAEDCQNRAMALVAFFGCLRSCELVALELKDIEEIADGVLIRITRMKTTARETRFIVPYTSFSCSAVSPAKVVLDYIAVVRPWLISHKLSRLWPRPIKSGYSSQFRGKNHMTVIAKAIAEFLNLNTANYTSHSFRRSSATAVADNGMSLLNLKRFGGWKSDTVASSYIDESLASIKEAAVKLAPSPASALLIETSISSTTSASTVTDQNPPSEITAGVTPDQSELPKLDRGKATYNFYFNNN